MEEENKIYRKGILLGVLSTVMVFLILAGIGIGIGVIDLGLKREQDYKVEIVADEDTGGDDFMSTAIKKINYVMKVMDMYYLEEYDEEAMIDGMLAGMLAAVGDPYTGYYDEESYSSLMESSEGVYYGIGVVVSQHIETGEVYVVNPYDGCPGAEAGMLPGDIIYKVAGTEVTGMDLDEVVTLIRGAEGTTVDVTVLHENSSELVDLQVERREIEVHTVEHQVMENNIGYVQITQFDEVTPEQFKSAMNDLKANNIKGLIVDLRDNPGGSLSAVIDVLDMLLPKGTYTYLVDKNGNRQDYKGSRNASYNYPTVVLVNENSASASELFTGAMHDFDKATIVGTTTFGKGIVQQIFPLRDGSGMKVTMAKYYTPDGICIHKTGIEPDVVVELDEGEYPSRIEYEDDEQWQKAVEILMEEIGK
ncbi:MAG: S41 family peptidase [Alistipes sp.]|nr:S41 family peptidase [Alistipes sp.]